MIVRNPHLIVQQTENYGLGVFVKQYIIKNEIVAIFTGPILMAKNVPLFPEVDHFMEIRPGIFLGPSGFEDDLINHSCSPF